MLNLAAEIALPPASLAVAALILLWGGRKARVASLIFLFALMILGLPIVASLLLNSLAPPPANFQGPPPEAIVTLSAEAVRTQDHARLEPGPLTLDRIRKGADLARSTNLPMLVAGGSIRDATSSLADMMDRSFTDDFGLAVRWKEDRSLDTWENAKFSAAILKAAGIHRVYLVTHDWHMRRSLVAFRHFGLDPVPVSARPAHKSPFTWGSLVINPTAWFNSFIAIHEWVGLAYYTIRW